MKLTVYIAFCIAFVSFQACAGSLVQFNAGGKKYWRSTSRINYSQAKNLCYQHGKQLVIIGNLAQSNAIYNQMKKLPHKGYYVDGNDIAKEGTWKNQYNQILGYKNWNSHEPNNWGGNEDCIEIGHHGGSKMNDINCATQYYGVCQEKPNYHKKCFSGNCYWFSTEKVTQAVAKARCSQKNWRLVQIQNLNQHNKLYDLAVNYRAKPYWIDGNDIVHEGKFVNSYKDTLSYTYWNHGEPNNYHNEDCIEVGHYGGRKWNDIKCSEKYYFICEKIPQYHKKCIGKSCYLLSTFKKNFLQAVAICHSKKMQLLQIKNKNMNTHVFNAVRNRGIKSYFIDGNDLIEEGKFKTTCMIALPYAQWAPHEPNNAGNEDCIEIGNIDRFGSNWNDISCSATRNFICAKH